MARLTVAARSNRFKPRIGYMAQVPQEGLDEPLRQLACQAQLRLTERFARLQARGPQINKMCVAVARELAGCIWALARASVPARA